MKIKRRYVFKRRMWLENFKKGVWGGVSVGVNGGGSEGRVVDDRGDWRIKIIS